MSVVKNMIVRVGADLSGLIGGFQKGGKSMDSFKKQASEALRSATLTQANLTKAMAQGGKNSAIVNLVDQIRELEAEQKQLQKLGFGWGYEGYEGNAALLRSLKQELNEYVKAQEEAAEATEETGEKTSQLGTAFRSAGGWIKHVGSNLFNVEKRSKASKSSVEGLLRSIRRLGIVSLGLRFVRAVFGELGTVVRQYIAENETLQAQVNGLRSAMGQALAPAINIVTNAMAALMPYVVGVSNAIGSLLQALGGGWATVAAEANGATKAIKGAGGAQKDLNRSLQGFDEITKLSSKSGGGGGGGSSSGATVTVEPITPQWVQDFVDALKAEIEMQDWGGVANVVIEGLSYGLGFGAGAIGKMVKEKLWDPFKNYFKKYIEKNRNEFPELGNDIGLGIIEGIWDAFANVGNWIHDHIWLPIKDGWAKAIGNDKIGNVQVGVENNTQTLWQRVKNWWNQKKEPVTFHANVANDSPLWNRDVKSYWTGGTLALDPLHVDLADDSAIWWQNVKSWWAKMAGNLSTKLEIKVPTVNVSWDKEIGPGGTIHIPKYNVQWNARGLIMDGAQLFGMAGRTLLGGGEAGREALLPLDRHTGWMDDIANRVALRIAGGGGASEQNITVNLLLDGKVVTNTVVRNINAEARATGRNPLAAYL